MASQSAMLAYSGILTIPAPVTKGPAVNYTAPHGPGQVSWTLSRRKPMTVIDSGWSAGKAKRATYVSKWSASAVECASFARAAFTCCVRQRGPIDSSCQPPVAMQH